MQARYYIHAAYLEGRRRQPRRRSASNSQRSWAAGTFARAVDRLEPTYGSFDPASYVFADAGASFESSDDYQAHVYEMVETDLDEALARRGQSRSRRPRR